MAVNSSLEDDLAKNQTDTLYLVGGYHRWPQLVLPLVTETERLTMDGHRLESSAIPPIR